LPALGIVVNQKAREAGLSDEDLMARVRDGETELLGELFRRYGERLYRYCWRMNQDQQLSEDLVQEAFCRVLRFRSGFRDGHRFEAWVYSIVRNLQMDHFRRRKFEGEWDEGMEVAAPRGEWASEVLHAKQEAELLHEALRRLPAAKRELLVLARFEELPHERIAEILGCEAGAARVRLHRALGSLREMYRQLLEQRSES
jgi:RNA polymerase sigma-70 factor (ECF subfamily)